MSEVGVPSTDVMRFGDPTTGSPFNPADGHGLSVHAKDKMVPRTVVIAAGGTVTFQVAPVHRVAVYDDDTSPSDISLANMLPAPILGIPNFQINDANNRLALQSDANFLSPRTFSQTFAEPGRYLVICVTTPHFVVGDMYGWVIVK
jgi:plastocyanin